MFWIIFSSNVFAHSSPDWISFCYFLSTFLHLGVYCFVKQKKQKHKQTKKNIKPQVRMFISCFCLCLKTHSPCYKHILKFITMHAVCPLRLKRKKKTTTDFKITYCCLITLWITRHTHAKRRWVRSSCARLRDGEFQGQWFSRKILLAPPIEKWNRAISEHHHKAKERWTPPKSGRWGRGTLQEGQTQHAGVEQRSIPGSTSKGPREPLGHHLFMSSQAKLSLSDHKPWPGLQTEDSEHQRFHALGSP